MSHYSRKSLGFTLIELLVSISIVSVILGVIISSQSTYNEVAALTNLAYEIGATISQARAYGIGVREFSPGSNEFSASYGLTFSLLGSGSNQAYIYFADRNSNNIYDEDWSCPTGGNSECLNKVDITNQNYIESLCVVRTSEGDLCDLGRVDISFVRPSTEAKIIFFDTNGQSLNPINMLGVKIRLQSAGGVARSVTLYSIGQVSVQ